MNFGERGLAIPAHACHQTVGGSAAETTSRASETARVSSRRPAEVLATTGVLQPSDHCLLFRPLPFLHQQFLHGVLELLEIAPYADPRRLDRESDRDINAARPRRRRRSSMVLSKLWPPVTGWRSLRPVGLILRRMPTRARWNDAPPDLAAEQPGKDRHRQRRHLPPQFRSPRRPFRGDQLHQPRRAVGLERHPCRNGGCDDRADRREGRQQRGSGPGQHVFDHLHHRTVAVPASYPDGSDMGSEPRSRRRSVAPVTFRLRTHCYAERGGGSSRAERLRTREGGRQLTSILALLHGGNRAVVPPRASSRLCLDATQDPLR